jgi:hypothetical protein
VFRKQQSDRTDAGAPRAKRGFGPFTGGQLTLIIVAIVVAVAFPVGAWAVSGSSVFVTDQTTGKTAAVNSSHQLSVTGTVTMPTGSIVRTHFAAPGPDWNFVQPNDCSSGCARLIKPPTGKALVVTSITADTDSFTNSEQIVVARSADGTCSAASLDEFPQVIGVAGLGHTEVDYPTAGLTVPAGKALCVLYNHGVGNITAFVEAVGYTVPSNAVTSSGASTPRGSSTLQYPIVP